MKCLPFLLLFLLLTGCSTVQGPTTADAVSASFALEEVLKLSSQSVDANLFATTPLPSLLPPEASEFSMMVQIPLFLDHLTVWQEQVRTAFRQVVVAIPSLVETNAPLIIWDDPDQIILQGNRSATDTFIRQQGEALDAVVRKLLFEALQQSEITWALILDRYDIWRKGTALWGREELKPVNVQPFAHLHALFVSQYLAQLGLLEEQLRTTPVPKGSGSFLEVFQKEARL
ncbi:MAG: hypothetical protein GX315_11060 [Spirochaetales bacterium]|jgi:hypothetical protein|nr:hypothetical protein [Spirochaetales bacterium]